MTERTREIAEEAPRSLKRNAARLLSVSVKDIAEIKRIKIKKR
jgi:hypothetical protein